MTSHQTLARSPYLIGFMLAALMVWSLSAITKAMDGALQPTYVDLRTPLAYVGTAIQDSAITLKHRALPGSGKTAASDQGAAGTSQVTRRSVTPIRQITPPLVAALTPITTPQAAAIAGLVKSASLETKKKVKNKGGPSELRYSNALGPAVSDAAHPRLDKQAQHQGGSKNNASK